MGSIFVNGASGGINSKKICFFIGLIIFIAGVIITVMSLYISSGDRNSITYDRTVQAEITDMEIIETKRSTTGGKNHMMNRVKTSEYSYEVTFKVYDGSESYTQTQWVSKDKYEEYENMEKNKRMDFNLYLNSDSNSFLSLGDEQQANEEYHAVGMTTKDIAHKALAGMIMAFFGMLLMSIVSKKNKRKCS